MTEGRYSMAWSSLSSLEIPTKADVQEALNSVSGIKYIWNGSYAINNSGASTNITITYTNYESVIIFGFLSEWGSKNLSIVMHSRFSSTFENYMTSGSHEYSCEVYATYTYVRFRKTEANGLDYLTVKTMIFV